MALIVVSAFKTSILNDNPATLKHVDYCWRLLIGLGCVPAVIALYFRLTIPETPRFTMDVERNVRRAAEDIDQVVKGGGATADDELIVRKAEVPKASWADFKAHFGQWKNGKVLIGTAWSWFALDVSWLCVCDVFTAFVCSPLIPDNITDRLLRPWSQLVYHPSSHWFRYTSYKGHTRSVRLSDERFCWKSDSLRCWPHPWLLGVIRFNRCLGKEANPVDGLYHPHHPFCHLGYVIL